MTLLCRRINQFSGFKNHRQKSIWVGERRGGGVREREENGGEYGKWGEGRQRRRVCVSVCMLVCVFARMHVLVSVCEFAREKESECKRDREQQREQKFIHTWCQYTSFMRPHGYFFLLSSRVIFIQIKIPRRRMVVDDRAQTERSGVVGPTSFRNARLNFENKHAEIATINSHNMVSM